MKKKTFMEIEKYVHILWNKIILSQSQVFLFIKINKDHFETY